MLAKILVRAVFGVRRGRVEVEVDPSQGKPGLTIGGSKPEFADNGYRPQTTLIGPLDQTLAIAPADISREWAVYVIDTGTCLW
jgi:hypothetical protein